MDKKNVSACFAHDANAMNDPKCMLLIEQFGMEGYGAFWGLVEMLRTQSDYRLPLVLVPSIAKRFNMSEAKLKTIIENYGLFCISEDSFFFSRSLIVRMNIADGAIRAKRLGGIKSGETRRMKALHSSKNEDTSKILQTYFEDTSNILQTYFEDTSQSAENFEDTLQNAENKDIESNEAENEDTSKILQTYFEDTSNILRTYFEDTSQNAENKDISVGSVSLEQQKKESPHIYTKYNITSKETPKGVKKANAFTPPTLQEVKEYCKSRNNAINPEKYLDFYTSKGWMIGKNKMKDWRAAVRTWEKNDENETPKNKSNETTGKQYDLI